ncbi:MAG: DUF5106 domain-containing protein [Bacteroidales bacterium]|nr:DUF5106 domain-containing protein [Bacteroidales bacterium]
MKTKYIIVLTALLLLCACNGPSGGNNASGGGNGSEKHSLPGTTATANTVAEPAGKFPMVSVPSVYDDNPDNAMDYMLEHYWDAFFKGSGSTTPNSILGVADGEFEQALSNYIEILRMMKVKATPDQPAPFKKATASIRNFFGKLEARQLADTSAKTYLRTTEKVSSYLFDPNSPMRDEDFYLPFVEGMLKSPCTREDMRNAFRYEASQCRRNGFGQTAADFSFKDARGNKGSLHGIRADYTMLFFSNPGCNSCKEIISEINSCGCISPMIADKRLAIVNIYIDEEVQKWRDYLPNYPKSWINGYDYTFMLRDSQDYDIRAIPSLYLLDSKKRVLMKDAPTHNVLAYLENIYAQ